MIDTSLLPLEKALLRRAEILEKFCPEVVPPSGNPHEINSLASLLESTQASAKWLAAEFRALAQELHH